MKAFVRIVALERAIPVRLQVIEPADLQSAVQYELNWQSMKEDRLVLLYSSKTGKVLPVEEVSKILAARPAASTSNGKK